MNTNEIIETLRRANEDFARHYPGETGHRQPVHTVYGGAHLFKSDSAQRLGSLARRSLEQFAPDAAGFAKAIDLPRYLCPDEGGVGCGHHLVACDPRVSPSSPLAEIQVKPDRETPTSARV